MQRQSDLCTLKAPKRQKLDSQKGTAGKGKTGTKCSPIYHELHGPSTQLADIYYYGGKGRKGTGPGRLRNCRRAGGLLLCRLHRLHRLLHRPC